MFLKKQSNCLFFFTTKNFHELIKEKLKIRIIKVTFFIRNKINNKLVIFQKNSHIIVIRNRTTIFEQKL